MEHAAELLPYAATIIGALIVYILNGVKTEIKDMGHTIKTLERDLRGGYADLDRRIAKVETRCELHHADHP